MAMQRRANWTPVIVSNRDVPTEHSLDDAVAGLAAPALLTSNVGGLSENNAQSLSQANQRQADLRFAIAVAIALALPAWRGKRPQNKPMTRDSRRNSRFAMAVQRRQRKKATQPTVAAVEERFGGLVFRY
jgi:hypothetical protein